MISTELNKQRDNYLDEYRDVLWRCNGPFDLVVARAQAIDARVRELVVRLRAGLATHGGLAGVVGSPSGMTGCGLLCVDVLFNK